MESVSVYEYFSHVLTCIQYVLLDMLAHMPCDLSCLFDSPSNTEILKHMHT